MRDFFYKIFWLIMGVQVHSQCPFTPNIALPEDGCKIGNLSIMLGEKRLISGKTCNLTIDPFLFDSIIQINVSLLDLYRKSAPSYLLSMVDRTSETLLWMISNLIPIRYPHDGVISLKTDNSVEIKPYSQPISTGYHVIEFLVFQEYRNHSSSNYIHKNTINKSPFNLSAWINSQQRDDITICGPIAGGDVVAYRTNLHHGIEHDKGIEAKVPATPLSLIGFGFYNTCGFKCIMGRIIAMIVIILIIAIAIYVCVQNCMDMC